MSAKDTIRVAFQRTAEAPVRRAAEKGELTESEPAHHRGSGEEALHDVGERTGFEPQELSWKN